MAVLVLGRLEGSLRVDGLNAESVILDVASAVLEASPTICRYEDLSRFAIDRRRRLILSSEAARERAPDDLLVLLAYAEGLFALSDVAARILVLIVCMDTALRIINAELNGDVSAAAGGIDLAGVVEESGGLRFLSDVRESEDAAAEGL